MSYASFASTTIGSKKLRRHLLASSIANTIAGGDSDFVDADLSYDLSDKAKLSVNNTGQYGLPSQSAFNAQFSLKF